MNEEKFLETVISKIECCLPRIFDCVGFPNDNGQFEQVVDWFYDGEKHEFVLFTNDYSTRTEVTLAKISVPNDAEVECMKDSLEEYMNFNVHKYFETFDFVIRGYKVSCKQAERHTPLEYTFFFSKT